MAEEILAWFAGADWHGPAPLTRAFHRGAPKALQQSRRTSPAGPVRPGPEGQPFLRTAYRDIPLVVPVIREFWMPDRARSWSA
jgi:hypothetical protein